MTKEIDDRIVFGIDLGATKVEVGLVNARGKILAASRVLIDRQPRRKKSAPGADSFLPDDLVRQIVDEMDAVYSKVRSKHPRQRRLRICGVGVGSAGPLDPSTGTLLDPTNLASVSASDPHSTRHWGQVPLEKLLRRGIKNKFSKTGEKWCVTTSVTIDNDAAAAILAEHWLGAARGYDNAMILTLGTGLGTGIIANGALVRSGRGLHPEAGHLILNSADLTAPCGCGNYGCAEAYLSGRNFERRMHALLHASRSKSEREALPLASAESLADQARAGNQKLKIAFEEVGIKAAEAIHNYAVLYAPERVILTGSFAHTHDLWLSTTRNHLQTLLARRRVGFDLVPQILISSLHNRAGLLGGARLAWLKLLAPSSSRAKKSKK